jgi:hypothetical protein
VIQILADGAKSASLGARTVCMSYARYTALPTRISRLAFATNAQDSRGICARFAQDALDSRLRRRLISYSMFIIKMVTPVENSSSHSVHARECARSIRQVPTSEETH